MVETIHRMSDASSRMCCMLDESVDVLIFTVW